MQKMHSIPSFSQCQIPAPSGGVLRNSARNQESFMSFVVKKIERKLFILSILFTTKLMKLTWFQLEFLSTPPLRALDSFAKLAA